VKELLVSRATIVRFTDDLRLADNPALAAAVARGGPVVPVYIQSTIEKGAWPLGPCGRAWLERSLIALDADLRARGSRLLLAIGEPAVVLADLVQATGADTVHAARRWAPDPREADDATEAALHDSGVAYVRFDGSLLHDPLKVRTRAGTPYRVFGPFARRIFASATQLELHDAPARLEPPVQWPGSRSIGELYLAPSATSALAAWRPGEAGAREHLRRFLDGPLEHYAIDRECPGVAGTSRLSPYLRFGEISPARVWAEARSGGGEAAAHFLRQLAWREFGWYLLVHFPHTADRPLKPDFEFFPWSRDPEGLAAWEGGRTGLPIVDAGMRELVATGWMHARVRMIVASVLTKDLLLPWQSGARFFWRHLFDADLASNTLGWQWVAGTGADAAPYLRVFNPTAQGERFDRDGAYVRRWVPELAGLPDRWIHRPWEAPPEVLAAAGVRLGETYPAPIIDHEQARRRALAIYEAIRGGGIGGGIGGAGGTAGGAA
jgi:deoxyribodipyrimidine photo-lyase